MEHHVYFWLKEERKGAGDRAQFETALAGLCAIGEVVSGRWGVPAAVEARPVVDLSWDYGLSLVFADLAGHDRYQVVPEHVAFVETYRSWWERVLVMDLA